MGVNGDTQVEPPSTEYSQLVIDGDTPVGAVNDTVSPPAILLIPVIVGAVGAAADAEFVTAEVSIEKPKVSVHINAPNNFIRD